MAALRTWRCRALLRGTALAAVLLLGSPTSGATRDAGSLGAGAEDHGETLATIQAWRQALETCQAEVCEVNDVDETATTARLCGAIRVASLRGGPGRTTKFGRLLWCAARLTDGPVMDLFAGFADTAALMADGIRHRSREAGRAKVLASFELSERRAQDASARLRADGVKVREVHLQQAAATATGAKVASSDAVAIREAVCSLMQCSEHHTTLCTAFKQGVRRTCDHEQVGYVLTVGSTSTPVRVDPTTAKEVSAVAEVCSALGSLSLVMLCPDVEMPWPVFAENWLAIERCGLPQIVAIYDVNLPGAAGWVLNRLKHLGWLQGTPRYRLLVDGFNNGEDGPEDDLYHFRCWAFLVRREGLRHPPGHPTGVPSAGEIAAEELYKGVARGEAAERVVEQLKTRGITMSNTMRSARGGTVQEAWLAQLPSSSLVMVAMQRPTDEMLPPPGQNTNPHTCFNDIDERLGARRLRVPCFMTCEGPAFDPRWGSFRRSAAANAAKGRPFDAALLREAHWLVADLLRNDSLLITGRLRFMARMRHEFTTDDHLDGFCLYGIATAFTIRARHLAEAAAGAGPAAEEHLGPPELVRLDLEVAFAVLSDEGTRSGIEFSMLENSGWPLRLEDVITNLEVQRAQLGSPFRLLNIPKAAPSTLAAQGSLLQSTGGPGLWVPATMRRQLRLCGIGNHLSATHDAMLMVMRSLEAASAKSTGMASGWFFKPDYLGRFCPKHEGQGHQCRQRCALLGVEECANEEDPISLWLDGILHPETLEELSYDITEQTLLLAQIAQGYERLAKADLLVCGHPTMMCLLLATVSQQPIFVHASSSLLYGMSCDGCNNPETTVRHYGDRAEVFGYLFAARELLLGGGRVVLFAEGAFMAKQIEYQVEVAVPWLPPLALYVPERQVPTSEPLVRALVLRSKYFVTLAGEFMRCLLRELGSLNSGRVPNITFLGKDNQFDEQWLSLEQIAGYGAAILYPNDLHQRTFHELYAMGMPIFMPDSLGLYRVQRVASWGRPSYSASLRAAGPKGPDEDAGNEAPEPWWNAYTARPEVVAQFLPWSDWEQFPLVQRFPSLPGLLDALLEVDLPLLAKQMLAFRDRLRAEALTALARPMLNALMA